jgi:hypothetical protein
MTIDATRVSRSSIGGACAVVAGLLSFAAHAQEQMIPGGQETFKLNLGGIVTTNNTSFRLDGNNGRGTDIDLEGVTGLKGDVSSFLVSGSWRIAPNHRFGADFFQIERDTNKAIDRTITIGDTVIPVNTSLQTEARTQFFIVNYQYSFVKNADMEFAGILGLYGANYKYKFTAVNPLIDIDKSTTAPLPLIGLSLDLYISPRWTASFFGEGLKLKVGDVDGSMYYVGASTDYMFTRNLGVGVGYRLADLKVDVDKGGFRGHIGWRTDSYTLYVQAKF